jgi:hypothetical protein
MPKIYTFDDYDQCMTSAGGPNTYCTVRTIVKPDNNSAVWKMIAEFSSDHKRHYEHSSLLRGICVNRCKDLVDKLSSEEQNELFVEEFPVSFPYKLITKNFKLPPEERSKLDRVVTICVNMELQESFGLKAFSTVERCDKSTDKSRVDMLDLTFIFLLIALIELNIVGTVYDFWYNKGEGSTNGSLISAFSLRRNLRTLFSNSNEELSREFRFIQAFRFLGMCLVIYAHVCLSNGLFPSQNPEEMEKIYHTVMVAVISNGTQIVQAFFFFSGMFLSILFFRQLKTAGGKQQMSVASFFKVIAFRYLRLTPVYAMIVLLHGTWASRGFYGPLASEGEYTEKPNCRANGWTNLLYVNNYIKVNEPVSLWFEKSKYEKS